MSTPRSITITSRTAIRRLAVARLISQAGSEAAFTALLFVLFRDTGSAAWVSVALLATFGTGGLAAPFAGSLGDRFDRRRVMIVSDVLGAVAFLSLAFVQRPGALVGLAFVAALVASPFYSSASAAVPNLVSDEELPWANGVLAFTASLGYLAGPVLGGALVGPLGAPAVFALNAASFLVSAALVASVRGRFSGERAGGHRDRGLREGFAFIAADPVLRAIAGAFCVFLLGVGSVVVADLPLSRHFGVGAFDYSLLAASWGVGSIAGALGVRRLRTGSERFALIGCAFVTAASLGAVALMPVFAPILALLVVAATSDSIFDVVIEMVFQRRTPDAIRSRVLAAFEGVAMVAFGGAFVFAGALVQAFGPRAAYAVAGGSAGVAGVVLAAVLLRAATWRPVGISAGSPPALPDAGGVAP